MQKKILLGSVAGFGKNCRWHGVASWTWDAHDDACGICRMAFDGCCPDCKMPGDDCPLSSFTNPPLLILLFLHLFAFAHFVDISTTQCLLLSPL